MLRIAGWVAFLLVAVVLAGCGVETYAGVELATPSYSPTELAAQPVMPDVQEAADVEAPPTENTSDAPPTDASPPVAVAEAGTPDLPQTAIKEFAGTTISLNYPTGWEVLERGQSISVVDPASLGGRPLDLRDSDFDFRSVAGISVFIQISRQFDQEDQGFEALAPMVLNRIVHGGENDGEPAGLAIDFDPANVQTFLWGERDAAAYFGRSADNSQMILLAMVLSEDRERTLLIDVQLYSDLWERYESTLLTMLGTLTLDGEALPASDVLAALQSIPGFTGAGPSAPVEVAGTAGEDEGEAVPSGAAEPGGEATDLAILPNTASKEFLGTTISFDYPADWELNERGQYIVAFDPAINGPTGPFVVARFQLTSVVSPPENLDVEMVAPYVLSVDTQRLVEGGFTAAEVAPAPEAVQGFRWGENLAAVYRWQTADGSVTGVDVLVLTRDQARYVVLGTQVSSEYWADFEPLFLTILGTAALDGTALPAADFEAAYRAGQ